METQAEVKSLRERVAEAALRIEHDRLESEAEFAQRNRKSLRKMLSERLGVEVEESAIRMLNDWAPIVEVEGFRFSIAHEGDLVMLVRCDACTKDYERMIWSVDGMADPFIPYPHENGYCLERELPPTSLTTELRLIQVLRDFIAENSTPFEG